MSDNPRPPLDKTQRRFEFFYSSYPKKRSKQDAWRAFLKLRPDGPAFKVIMDGLVRCKESEDWKKEGGKYIPHPATWLRAAGWLDEFEDSSPVTSLYDAQKAYDRRAGIY